jgi:hypothetical protein
LAPGGLSFLPPAGSTVSCNTHDSWRSFDFFFLPSDGDSVSWVALSNRLGLLRRMISGVLSIFFVPSIGSHWAVVYRMIDWVSKTTRNKELFNFYHSSLQNVIEFFWSFEDEVVDFVRAH